MANFFSLTVIPLELDELKKFWSLEIFENNFFRKNFVGK